MKNTNRYAVSLMSGIAFLLLGSCSEKVSDDLGGAENETLDIWMQNNRPDIPKAEDGLYYKIYETEDSQDIDVEWRNWVSVTYTGQALNGYFPENGGRFTGDYYENFYPEIARELGTFSYFCHYVPYLTNNNELLQYTLTPGATKVLRQMQQGDSVEIFMTSQHAYGSGGYFSQLDGFEGNKELEGNRPVYMSMKLCEVIADPVKIDEEKTIAYKQYLISKNYAAASINSMLAAVNGLLSFLGWDDCKIKVVRIQRKVYCTEEKELSKIEYMRLLNASKNNIQLNLILQTICATGIRISELKYFTLPAIKRGEVMVRCKNKTRTRIRF